jgi:5-oxoprolinase (ATP-hydrolysing) subunit A
LVKEVSTWQDGNITLLGRFARYNEIFAKNTVFRRGGEPPACLIITTSAGRRLAATMIEHRSALWVLMIIDLNSDLGEGCGLDADLMPLITSANVSCGFHAGDAHTASLALNLAAQHGVQVGAHPGYADREHFGRRNQTLSADALIELILSQVGALAGLAKSASVTLRYIKPHGALYNQATIDDAVAAPVVQAATILGLPLMGLPGSRLQALCQSHVRFIAEGFADRRYHPDGTLAPRSEPDAFVHDIEEAVKQAEWLMCERGIQSLCIHGDNPQALEFARGLRDAFTRRGITVRAFA